jgi:hypothetical protein
MLRRLRTFTTDEGTCLIFEWRGTPSRTEELLVRQAMQALVRVAHRGEEIVTFVDYDVLADTDRMIVRPEAMGGKPRYCGEALPR